MIEELGAYLEANGGGVTVGTDLFYGNMPTEPSVCSALVPYEGAGFHRRQSGGRCEINRVQLVHRAETYDSGIAAIRTMGEVLDGIVNETLGTSFYQRVEMLQPPFYLERDAADRYVFAVNFQVTREWA